MTTLQIQLDETVADSFAQKARLAGKTPEALAAELIIQQTPTATSKEWIKRFLENAEKYPGHSGGWKWNREEIYDR